MKPKQLKELGEKLETMRRSKGLLQATLADKAGVRKATISGLESGKLNFRINTLSQAVEAMDCTLEIRIKPKL